MCNRTTTDHNARKKNPRRNTTSRRMGIPSFFAFHCHTDCSVGGCHCQGKVAYSACILCMCGCMGVFFASVSQSGYVYASLPECVCDCICCLEGRVRLWIHQTYCNCIPSYTTAVFPRVCVSICVCVKDST